MKEILSGRASRKSRSDWQFALVTWRPYCPGRPEKLCFTMLSLAVETMEVRLGVVKQSFFWSPGTICMAALWQGRIRKFGNSNPNFCTNDKRSLFSSYLLPQFVQRLHLFLSFFLIGRKLIIPNTVCSNFYEREREQRTRTTVFVLIIENEQRAYTELILNVFYYIHTEIFASNFALCTSVSDFTSTNQRGETSFSQVKKSFPLPDWSK